MVALRRIEGQVRGVQRMVEDRKYCIDILNQINAVKGALARVEERILKKHFQHCVTEAVQGTSEKEKQEKLDEIWEYQTSPLYSEAERVALDFAMAAGSVPNAVDAELFDRMREHWEEAQIVQILGAVCLYGFLNRWNDSMATDLEDEPRAMGERVLTQGGWTGGKHV